MSYAGLGMLYNTGRGIFKPGGYGGGIFDGNLSGLGADEQYPWHAYSDATLALQKNANDALRARGLCTLTEDGKLGAATCGASRSLIGQAPPTCQSYTEPKGPPCGVAATAPSVSIPASLAPPPVTAASMQFGTSIDWTKYAAFAAGALLVVGGLYYFTHRKGQV